MSTPPAEPESGRRIDIGRRIDATDGPVGEVQDVVINPVRLSVTHLVVGPHRHHQDARLIPIEHVTPADDGSLGLNLTSAEVADLPRVEERDFFRLQEWPEPTDQWDVGITEVLALPYHAGDFGPTSGRELDGPSLMGFDRIPVGEVEVRRLSPVFDSEGEAIGHVESFIVDPDDHITHIVIDRGHLWNHREITMPMSVSHRVRNDEMRLDITLDELDDLPTVRYHRHH